jgi:hypothetical protein
VDEDVPTPLNEIRDYAVAVALRITRGNRDLSEDVASDVMLMVAMSVPPRLAPFSLNKTMCKGWLVWRVQDRLKNKVYRNHMSLPNENTQKGWTSEGLVEVDQKGAVHICTTGTKHSVGEDSFE